MGDTPKQPWLYKLRSSESFVILVVSIAIFTDVFIYGMIVPIIPVALVERVGTREEDAQSWVSMLLAVYGGTLLIGSPLFGYFADACHLRRLPFIIGLAALGASTILFVLARSIALLIVARGLQGLSAAAVWVVGLAIVADNVPPERVGEAMGHTTIALTWGCLLGPTVGGVLYERLGFNGTFAVPGVLILVDVVLRFAMIERPAISHSDKPSLVSHDSAARVSSYSTFGHRDDIDPGYSSDSVGERAPLLAVSIPYVEAWAESTQRKANVLDLLRSPRLPLALVATVMMAISFAALETTLPLYVIETFNWSSSGAGIIFIASALPSFAGPYVGKVVTRLGARIPGTTALIIGCIAWILMRLVDHNTIGQIILLVTLLLVLGLTIVTNEITAMTEVFQVIEDYEAEFPGSFGERGPVAQGYALFNMAFAAGQLLGPILAGGLKVKAGWGAETSIIGILYGVTALPMAFLSGRRSRGSCCENDVGA